jgi:tetratricopeptide (TPR) repeat protein
MEIQQDYFPALLAAIKELEPALSIERLRQAAYDHPNDVRPLLLLAAEHAGIGRIDEAEAAYIAVLQRAPDFAIARFQLGLLQFTSARPAAARATWLPLDMLDPGDPLRLFKTGLEFLAEDKFEEAKQWLMKGIAQNQGNLPLNRDMQRLIDEIAKLQEKAPRPSVGTPAAPATAAKEESAADEHFLLSSYRSLH